MTSLKYDSTYYHMEGVWMWNSLSSPVDKTTNLLKQVKVPTLSRVTWSRGKLFVWSSTWKVPVELRSCCCIWWRGEVRAWIMLLGVSNLQLQSVVFRSDTDSVWSSARLISYFFSSCGASFLLQYLVARRGPSVNVAWCLEPPITVSVFRYRCCMIIYKFRTSHPGSTLQKSDLLR